MTTSVPLKQAIEKQLKELRRECAVQRLIKSNAFGRRWALGGRGDVNKPGSNDQYWDDRQAKAQVEATAAVEAADRALAEFISESRSVMGADWIGNDHGRLCWAPFLGGYPIDQHYCHLPEGHEGHHCNHVGAWHQGRTN